MLNMERSGLKGTSLSVGREARVEVRAGRAVEGALILLAMCLFWGLLAYAALTTAL